MRIEVEVTPEALEDYLLAAARQEPGSKESIRLATIIRFVRENLVFREPVHIGSVVSDQAGTPWMRDNHTEDAPWMRLTEHRIHASWEAIDAVKLIHHGWDPDAPRPARTRRPREILTNGSNG